MPSDSLVQELAAIAAGRLGGNLRLLAVYGSAADHPQSAHDIDFILVVDAVESCVTHATQDCRDHYRKVQFFVLNAQEYADLPPVFRFQFTAARKIAGDLSLPTPSIRDAVEAVQHGFTDSLRTLRQQFKRREWAAADDWARQVWWSLKSFKYALYDLCWIIRGERITDPLRAALVLEAEGCTKCARAITEWPSLENASSQLLKDPIQWIHRWELLLSGAYLEARMLLKNR